MCGLQIFMCRLGYVGETSRHFSTRVREHLATDRASHVYKHLQQSESCRNLCSANCFSIIDYATTSFQLKIKESLHIHWDKPTLNQQADVWTCGHVDMWTRGRVDMWTC